MCKQAQLSLSSFRAPPAVVLPNPYLPLPAGRSEGPVPLPPAPSPAPPSSEGHHQQPHHHPGCLRTGPAERRSGVALIPSPSCIPLLISTRLEGPVATWRRRAPRGATRHGLMACRASHARPGCPWWRGRMAAPVRHTADGHLWERRSLVAACSCASALGTLADRPPAANVAACPCHRTAANVSPGRLGPQLGDGVSGGRLAHRPWPMRAALWPVRRGHGLLVFDVGGLWTCCM